MTTTDQQTTPIQPVNDYVVLARKYRPTHFGDLIGQHAMVKTLENAFKTGRIAQGFMLTGVRGTGKTTTARILARGLNFELDGEESGPTTDLEIEGLHCRAIMESRHVDVIEMDAASHTGINDIREIIDSIHYKPAYARYKVYIIDEVHMLSIAAFNGLLKTLEEPPAHVKFIFATTEIRKVPVTILSRCQRFDLHRVQREELVAFLDNISSKENAKVEKEALQLIARAGEGSVRDSLSILDQAISHGQGQVTANSLRQLLGLADQSRILDVFEQIMRGDIKTALNTVNELYHAGADPIAILTDLIDFTHFVTKAKVINDDMDASYLAPEERARAKDFSSQLSMAALNRVWQMLLKGIEEVKQAAQAMQACEMILIRIAYAASLPSPEEAIKLLETQAEGNAGPTHLTDGAIQADGAVQANGAIQTSSASEVSSHGSEIISGQPSTISSSLQGHTKGPISPSAQLATQMSPLAPDTEISAEPQVSMIEIDTVEALFQLIDQHRELKLKYELENSVQILGLKSGAIELALLPKADARLVEQLTTKLLEWTGKRWIIAVSKGDETGESIADLRHKKQQDLHSVMAEDPLVKKVLETFPGSKITDVKQHNSE